MDHRTVGFVEGVLVLALVLCGFVEDAIAAVALVGIARRPRQRVPVSRLFIVIAALLVFVAFTWIWLPSVLDGPASTPLAYLLSLLAIAVTLMFAMRRGEAAAGILYGLAASIGISAAEWLLLAFGVGANPRSELIVIGPTLPAVVALCVFARMAQLRTSHACRCGSLVADDLAHAGVAVGAGGEPIRPRDRRVGERRDAALVEQTGEAFVVGRDRAGIAVHDLVEVAPSGPAMIGPKTAPSSRVMCVPGPQIRSPTVISPATTKTKWSEAWPWRSTTMPGS